MHIFKFIQVHTMTEYFDRQNTRNDRHNMSHKQLYKTQLATLIHVMTLPKREDPGCFTLNKFLSFLSLMSKEKYYKFKRLTLKNTYKHADTH